LEVGGELEELVELDVLDVERYVEREVEVEVQEVKWKVQVVEVAEGGVREGEEGRLLCIWSYYRKSWLCA